MRWSATSVICSLLVLGGARGANAADGEEKEPDDDSFPLLQRGLVIGAGAGLHVLGIAVADQPVLKRVATTGFAYLGLMPGYWGSYDETDAYCASYHTQAGLDRADAVAIRNTLHVKKAPKDLTPDEVEQVRVARHWTLGVPADCGYSRKFGGFIALPSSFDDDVTRGTRTESVTIHPLFIAGAMFAPRPWINVLVGVTFSNVAVSSSDIKRDQLMLSGFVGLGTPFDAIGQLFK
jgi:hypothetical protein